MKKFLLILAAAFILTSCASIHESDFLNHDTMYRNWDHLKFSWGLTDPTSELHKQVIAEDWWGLPTKVSD